MVIGIATILPWLYIPVFIALANSFVNARIATMSEAVFSRFFMIHLAVSLFTMALMGFYIVYLFRTTVVPADKKTLWAVVLFMASMVAMPVFWYLYLWKPAKAQPAVTPA